MRTSDEFKCPTCGGSGILSTPFGESQSDRAKEWVRSTTSRAALSMAKLAVMEFAEKEPERYVPGLRLAGSIIDGLLDASG